jgi:glycosyltransferase involved in cell wall biosynthesis
MLAIDGLGIGGAEMVVRDLARFLDRDRVDVCVCCTKGLGSIGEELLREGIDVFVLPRREDGKVDYLTPVKLRQAVKDRRIDVLHTHAPSAFWDAGLCKVMMPSLKVVHTFHYGNYPHLAWRTRWMEAMTSRIVNRLVAVGRQQRGAIQATYRLPDSRVETIWNGAPPAASEATSSFRDEHGTGDRLLVGTIAKLIPQKGLDDLLSVARRCRDAGYAMQFVILGEGPLRRDLEARRHELGLDDTVVLAGWVSNAAARALPVFDVFFQSSRWEAMSIAILEAMAAGKAIVATRVGDNPHVLEDEVTGLLVEPGDVAGMADALSRLRDQGLRRRLGSAARQRFHERFTLEHMTRAYERLYAELVAG